VYPHKHGECKTWHQAPAQWAYVDPPHLPIFHDDFQLPSGYVKMAIENGPFIVDLPINSMVIFPNYVSLPEGNGEMYI
jgi:hypothetical protein